MARAAVRCGCGWRPARERAARWLRRQRRRHRRECAACHRGRAGFNQAFHKLEGIERCSESGFGIRDDRQHPVDRVLAVCVDRLLGADQRIVDGAHNLWNATGEKALIGIHLTADVGVCSGKSGVEINCLQTGFSDLDCLVARDGALCGHVFPLMKEPP